MAPNPVILRYHFGNFVHYMVNTELYGDIESASDDRQDALKSKLSRHATDSHLSE